LDSDRPGVRKRLYLASLLVLLTGLCVAAVLYLAAGDLPPDASGYQTVVVDGRSYRVPLDETKMYVRDLERFGGKAAVLFDEFNRWFAGLWVGRSLALTVLWISVAAAAAIWIVARYALPDPVAANPAGNQPPDSVP
jgi:hypothetical protein